MYIYIHVYHKYVYIKMGDAWIYWKWHLHSRMPKEPLLRIYNKAYFSIAHFEKYPCKMIQAIWHQIAWSRYNFRCIHDISSYWHRPSLLLKHRLLMTLLNMTDLFMRTVFKTWTEFILFLLWFVFAIFLGKGFLWVGAMHQDRAELKRATPVEAFNMISSSGLGM